MGSSSGRELEKSQDLTCTERAPFFDAKIRIVDRTWTGFEFSRQEKSHVMNPALGSNLSVGVEKSHVMGRVPDVDRLLGLILLKSFLLWLSTGREPSVIPVTVK